MRVTPKTETVQKSVLSYPPRKADPHGANAVIAQSCVEGNAMTKSLGGHASAVTIDALRRGASRRGWRMLLKSYNPNIYFLYHPQIGFHAGGDAVDLSFEHIAAFLDSELVIRSSAVGVA